MHFGGHSDYKTEFGGIDYSLLQVQFLIKLAKQTTDQIAQNAVAVGNSKWNQQVSQFTN